MSKVSRTTGSNSGSFIERSDSQMAQSHVERRSKRSQKAADQAITTPALQGKTATGKRLNVGGF